jgi:hypothetical protein
MSFAILMRDDAAMKRRGDEATKSSRLRVFVSSRLRACASQDLFFKHYMVAKAA